MVQTRHETKNKPPHNLQSLLMVRKLMNMGKSVLRGCHEKQQRCGIPKELHEVEILKRLPVRSLLRFRSVSKSWKTLIDSNYFINLHLQHYDINHDDCLVAVSGSTSVIPCGIDVLDKSSCTKLFRFDTGLVDEVSVALNFIGTCNGLICTHAEYYLEHCYRTNYAYLWNPVMGVTKVIDHQVRRWDDDNLEFVINYGFGYDSENNDYKVVMFEHLFSFDLPVCIAKKVYSLNNSSWKTIDQFTPPSKFAVVPHYLHYNRTPFVHGAIHWLAFEWTSTGPRVNHDQIAISFRIREEVFEEIVLPPGKKCNNLLSSYKSLLACMLSDLDKRRDPLVHLWEMKEYGVSESWTKLYTIDPSVVAGLGCFVNFIGFGEDENEHVLGCQSLINYMRFGEDENQHVLTYESPNEVLFLKNYNTSRSQVTTFTSVAKFYDHVDAITFRPSLVNFFTNIQT